MLLNPIGSSPIIATCVKEMLAGETTDTDIGWPGLTILPDVGEVICRDAAAATVKFTPLLARPPTVTITFPVVAPFGTITPMFDSLRLVITAVAPLKPTVLTPFIKPKPVPEIVTTVPTAPEVGERLVMVGTTVKRDPLLLSPTSTTTVPVSPVFGTVTTMLVGLQLTTGAGYPSNLTTLFP